MRKIVRALLGVGLAASGLVIAGEREARACGGCFVPPPPPKVVQTESVITDEQMILSIAMSQTTLYDEIKYSGSPASFAWVLPIKGQVQVGLSADILFQTINQLTTTTITQPASNCPPPPQCGGGGAGCGASASTASGFAAPGGLADLAGADGGADGVTVTSEKQVGPYETVQLHSNDGSALTAWLTSHGYEIPDYTKPVVDAYVADGFDFLALKLVPGEGVNAMQPVRVTSQGAAPSLPLHMVAVGTGPVTGITIWVVAEGRWEPANFPTFSIEASDLAWDWLTSSSNYEQVRLSKQAAFQGRGWQIESSLELNQYTIQQTLLRNVAYDTNDVGGYSVPVPTDAGAPDASRADAGSPGLDEDAGEFGFDGGEVDAGFGYVTPIPKTVETEEANADLDVLLAGIARPNVRITRMRSDVAKAALSVDMYLRAAKDQSELTNAYTPTHEVGEPYCAVYDSNCQQTGTVPRSQASSSAGGKGCSTTTPRNELGTTLAFLLAFGGVAAVRGRRRKG